MSKKKPENDPSPAPEAVETIFTIPELARRWRVGRHVIAAAIRSGRLQAFKPGAHYRIRESEILRHEQQQIAVAS